MVTNFELCITDYNTVKGYNFEEMNIFDFLKVIEKNINNFESFNISNDSIHGFCGKFNGIPFTLKINDDDLEKYKNGEDTKITSIIRKLISMTNMTKGIESKNYKETVMRNNIIDFAEKGHISNETEAEIYCEYLDSEEEKIKKRMKQQLYESFKKIFTYFNDIKEFYIPDKYKRNSWRAYWRVIIQIMYNFACLTALLPISVAFNEFKIFLVPFIGSKILLVFYQIIINTICYFPEYEEKINCLLKELEKNNLIRRNVIEKFIEKKEKDYVFDTNTDEKSNKEPSKNAYVWNGEPLDTSDYVDHKTFSRRKKNK